jgi:Domain of unknown function (DUF5655)
MWICPKCKRSFKRKDQTHSCILITKESLFDKRPAALEKIYEQVVKIVQQFGEYREETVRPDVIYFKTKSTFLGVKVKKDHLEIEFFLDHLENIPPVSKYLQTSKNRIAHVVPVDAVKDINRQLSSWIKHSYDLVSK